MTGWVNSRGVGVDDSVVLSIGMPDTPALVAIRAGSITGISALASADVTAGVLMVQATKNGTPVTLAATFGVGTQVAHATQASGIDTFMPGDLLGIVATSDADFEPILTIDVLANLEISFA